MKLGLTAFGHLCACAAENVEKLLKRWTNFSGLTILVDTNLWVGSVTAQSQPDRTWSGSRPLPCSLYFSWSLMPLGCDIPFRFRVMNFSQLKMHIYLIRSLHFGMHKIR